LRSHTTTAGLDLPISGRPAPTISSANAVTRVALVGDDYVGMKPSLAVEVGQQVKLGELLFHDKKIPGVQHTSPACGTVIEINRGAKRKFESLVIEIDGDEQVEFNAIGHDLGKLDKSYLVDILIRSGLWTSLRTRPFSNTADPATTPSSIFVTVIDTEPLAFNPEIAINQKSDAFLAGLRALTHLAPTVHVCIGPTVDIPGEQVDGVEFHCFHGPHPAGLPGTHIHMIDPVGPHHQVWHINYQDVSAIGTLITTGILDVERFISIGGPVVSKPRLLSTRLGVNIGELTAGELTGENNRIISGSVLSGRATTPNTDYLGRFHNQISALAEGHQREFLGWQMPGFNKFSLSRVFASTFTPGKTFAFTTSNQGEHRAMVPFGTYEKVMPLDILPTQLLRALITQDTEESQLLGCLELAEEDLALCTFVCPGKYEYGDILRDNLHIIQKEG
jgi:Na+-transporting NADH:ubiquinone oxidoreductase subunit A